MVKNVYHHDLTVENLHDTFTVHHAGSRVGDSREEVMTLQAADLKGLVPAAVLPMEADGTINEAGLRSYMKWLEGQGPVGLAINVDTGEGGHLTHAERLRVLEIVKETVSVPLVCGLHGPSTAQAVAEAKDLKAAGADALMPFPIVAYQSRPLDPRIPVEYHRAISEVGVPIVLFQLQPSLSGITFEPDTLRQLLRLEGVIALKEASFDANTMRRTSEIIHGEDVEVTILTGNDNFMLESFMLGSDGGLLGFGSMMTDEMVDMIKAWHAGDLVEAKRLGVRTQLMADAIFAAPVSSYRSRLKEALVMLGVFEEGWANVRLPLHRVDDQDVETVRKVMSRLELV